MKRRFTTALVMLLAFALLIGTTAISASAENTYTVNGANTQFNKYLVVDSDTKLFIWDYILVEQDGASYIVPSGVEYQPD